jgi:putative nucleotidyltransferase with HDIG domain
MLKFANSSLLGSGEVNSIDRATELMGFEAIRDLVISLSFFTKYQELGQEDSEEGFNLRDLWQHNLGCAIASQLFAEKLKQNRPQEVFTAGLLHDIGKMVLFQWKPDLYREVVREASLNIDSVLAAEDERIGFGHTMAGKLAMEAWGFPKHLVDAVWLHHQPFSRRMKNSLERIPFLVKCGDSLCHMLNLSGIADTSGDWDIGELKESTGLKEKDIEEITVSLLERYEESSILFDWETSTAKVCATALARSHKKLTTLQTKVETSQKQISQELPQRAVWKRLLDLLHEPISLRQASKHFIGLY